MTYAEVTTINATKGLPEIFTYINTVTDNWISNMIVIAIYVIILIGFYKARNDFTGALAVAGYGTFVVSVFFWLGGFITGGVLAITLAGAIIGTVILFLDKD